MLQSLTRQSNLADKFLMEARNFKKLESPPLEMGEAKPKGAKTVKNKLGVPPPAHHIDTPTSTWHAVAPGEATPPPRPAEASPGGVPGIHHLQIPPLVLLAP